jgi:uncharacterized protein YecT (DUF1311 family)
MKLLPRLALTCLAASFAASALAGALEECMTKPDHAAVTRCLTDADRAAQDALVKAEGDIAKRAREIDTATGRSGAAAAFAKSMRAFSDYRRAQCDYVRAMYAGGNGADQGQLACMVDMTRRRVRDLQN